MIGSVRILHYNTQFRAWVLEMGSDQTLLTSNPAIPRARQLAGSILGSRHDYDVICLNEVFDEPARDVLVELLEPRYPHILVKADLGRVVVQSDGWVARDLNPLAFLASYTFHGQLVTMLTHEMPKFDDSGLMIFSRFPFADMPLTDDVRNLLDPAAIPTRLTSVGIPRVAGLTYGDSSGFDGLSSKGIAYAGLVLPDDSLLHVFATHTQADTTASGELAGIRRDQLAQAHEFVIGCTESPRTGPLPEQTVVLGDFNVVGALADDELVPPPAWEREWRAWADTRGASWREDLIDVWGRDQCRGGADGATDPGFTARTNYDPPRQRLDYAFRSTFGRSSHAVQHVWVDHDVADPPRGGRDPFLSDHRPLGLDLAPAGDMNSVATAHRAPIGFDDDTIVEGWLPVGQVAWVRFDVPGTYDMAVNWNHDPARLRYEVYWASDLSTPRHPYRGEVHPDFGPRYVIPVAPFFVKILPVDRRHDEPHHFRFVAHRHDGTSPSEAHVLAWGAPLEDQFPQVESGSDQQHIDGDETDTKWIRLDAPSGLSTPVTMTVDTGYDGRAPASGDAVLALIRQIDGGQSPLVATPRWDADFTWRIEPGERYFLCVKRRPAGGPPFRFWVHGHLDVGFLVGRGEFNHLRARRESSGAGADDVRLTVRRDDAAIWSGPERSLNGGDSYQLFAQALGNRRIPYRRSVEWVVTEVDATSANDVGRAVVPLPQDVQPGGRVISYVSVPLPPERAGALAQSCIVELELTVEIPVDDGFYDAHLLLATWTES